jgi:hypothetical protein
MRSSLLPLLLLAACSPAPSSDDVGVYLRDSGARDRTSADQASADSSAVDAAAADAASADASAVDGTAADRATTDTAAASDLVTATDTAASADHVVVDSSGADLGPADTHLFYGPYAATGLPRVINDATASGTAVTTVALSVPQNLNVDFADVHVEISHEDVRDLWVQLVPPIGNADTLYDGTSCSSSCPPSLVIDQRIQVYNATTGSWVLRISDRNQSHIGTLQSYTLNFIP